MSPTALLIMDVQQDIVERFASDDGYLGRLAAAIAAARGAGIAVTYVTVGFRPGYPEVSERPRMQWRGWLRLRNRGFYSTAWANADVIGVFQPVSNLPRLCGLAPKLYTDYHCAGYHCAGTG